MNSQKLVCVTLLCVVFCFDWSTQDKIELQLKPPQVLELRQQAEVCSKETGVPADNIKKVIDNSLPKDQANKEFFLCVAKNTGYFDQDANAIPEKFVSLNLVDVSEEHVANSIKECNKIPNADRFETARLRSGCIYDQYLFTILK